MINAVKVVCSVAVAIPVLTYGSQSGLARKTTVDPGGCLIEHIAAEEGMPSFSVR